MEDISKIMQFKKLDQQVNECLAAWHGQQYKNKKLQGAVKVTVFSFLGGLMLRQHLPLKFPRFLLFDLRFWFIILFPPIFKI